MKNLFPVSHKHHLQQRLARTGIHRYAKHTDRYHFVIKMMGARRGGSVEHENVAKQKSAREIFATCLHPAGGRMGTSVTNWTTLSAALWPLSEVEDAGSMCKAGASRSSTSDDCF